MYGIVHRPMLLFLPSVFAVLFLVFSAIDSIRRYGPFE